MVADDGVNVFVGRQGSSETTRHHYATTVSRDYTATGSQQGTSVH